MALSASTTTYTLPSKALMGHEVKVPLWGSESVCIRVTDVFEYDSVIYLTDEYGFDYPVPADKPVEVVDVEKEN